MEITLPQEEERRADRHGGEVLWAYRLPGAFVGLEAARNVYDGNGVALFRPTEVIAPGLSPISGNTLVEAGQNLFRLSDS